jgi:hypothetical protein
MWTEKPYNQICLDYFIKTIALSTYIAVLDTATKEQAKLLFKTFQPYREKYLSLLQQLTVYLNHNFELDRSKADETTDCVKKLLIYTTKQLGINALRRKENAEKLIIETAAEEYEAKQRGQEQPADENIYEYWNPSNPDMTPNLGDRF